MELSTYGEVMKEREGRSGGRSEGNEHRSGELQLILELEDLQLSV